ncbi:MAG TPA: leucine-rich repeat domain-containing protein [Pirellulales bacterium]|nr:leucine-rich repeat domain-containing protein [Pirellulales bacterium]
MRKLRFPLRLMLVLVTALCIAMGVWIAPRERQRRVVAAIEALEGTVDYVDRNQRGEESFLVTLLRRWLPPVYFDEIIEVNLADTRITDEGLAQLQELSSLESLYLDNTKVTDAGLVHVRRLASLQELRVGNTEVTDVGVPHLLGLTSLRVLNLDNTQITDAGLARLQGIKSLNYLTLNGTKITPEGAGKFFKALPRCGIWGP